MQVKKFAGAMPEHASVQVEIGEHDGDNTRTAIEFAFEAGVAPTVILRKDRHEEDVSSVRIELVGEWEREGFARAMAAAATELLKK
jgi:hypothetical protein